METGVIYQIINPIGEIYIGRTVDFRNRISKHKSLFYLNKDKKREELSKLQISFLDYGFENHKFKVIKSNLKKDELNNWEIFYIKKFNSKEKGLNITDGGTEEQKITYVLDIQEKIIYEFKSLTTASIKFKVSHRNTYRICLGELKTFNKKRYTMVYNLDDLITRGFIDSLKNIKIIKNSEINLKDEDISFERDKKSNSKLVYVLDIKEKIIYQFSSQADVGRYFSVCRKYISKISAGTRKTFLQGKYTTAFDLQDFINRGYLINLENIKIIKK